MRSRGTSRSRLGFLRQIPMMVSGIALAVACVPADDPEFASALASVSARASAGQAQTGERVATPTPTPSPMPSPTLPAPKPTRVTTPVTTLAPTPKPTAVPTPTLASERAVTPSVTLTPTGLAVVSDVVAGAETPRPPGPTPTPSPTPTPTPAPTLTPEEAEEEALERFLETPKGELKVVSDAVAFLMLQSNLTSIPNPVTAGTLPCPIGTQDMTAFPDATSGVATSDKLKDAFGRDFARGVDPLGDKDGYVLIGHDVFADHEQIRLQSYLSFTRSAWCYSVDGDGTVHQHEPGKLQVLGDVDELWAAFSEDDGSARLVLLLSPESGAARARSLWVQWQVLDPNPEIDLKVYVVWHSMSSGGPYTWPIVGLTPDERITEYWDKDQLAGRSFAADLGSNARDPQSRYNDLVAYDVYYLFGPDARWGEEPPDLLSTEVDHTIHTRFALRSALGKLFPGME